MSGETGRNVPRATRHYVRSTGPPLAGVLWDLDGTLIDSRVVWETAYHELAKQQGACCTPELWERMAGRSLEASVAQLFSHAGLALAPNAVARACSWLVARMHQLLDEQPALLQWRPGAQQALQTVQRAGIPTALVTTTWRSLTDHIITVLDARFDATVCGDEVARGKPAPDPYLRAAALLGASPAGCVVVEDTPAGVAAAEAAGIAVLAVPSHAAIVPQARRVVRSSLLGLTLDELTVIVDPASGSRPNRMTRSQNW